MLDEVTPSTGSYVTVTKTYKNITGFVIIRRANVLNNDAPTSSTHDIELVDTDTIYRTSKFLNNEDFTVTLKGRNGAGFIIFNTY